MNLGRKYGRPLPEPNRAVAWLKTTITSDRKQAKKVDIGWTRELWIFVNRKLVYADKNLFESEEARKARDGRCSLENGAFTLPLEAGDNHRQCRNIVHLEPISHGEFEVILKDGSRSRISRTYRRQLEKD